MKTGKSAKQLADGTQVIKGDAPSRRIRSPHGGQYAVPVTLPNGDKVLRTPSGQMYKERKF